jgi:putative transposase
MARPLRIQYPGAWYHVMNRGRSGESIFLEEKDYLALFDLLKDTVEMWHADIAAYCLMSNHYHLLIRTPDANLSRCMRHINGVYTQRFNRAHDRDGPLFRGRYKAILVDADGYLLELVRYIHRNPVEAGLTDRLDAYPWTSHKGYLSEAKKWDWLHKDYVLSMFSDDMGRAKGLYKAFVSKESSREIGQLLVRRKWPAVLGDAGFVQGIKRRFFSKKRHKEVPESRSLAPDVDTIKRVVCRFYGVDGDGLLASRRGTGSEARKVAIYLVRQLCGSSLDEIAGQFAITNYSTVSTVISRTKTEMTRNHKLNKRVKELKQELQMSQEQT